MNDILLVVLQVCLIMMQSWPHIRGLLLSSATLVLLRYHTSLPKGRVLCHAVY